MEQQLEKIFRDSFDLDLIDDSMSIENVPCWDSMAHVGLIMALQRQFKVDISPAQAIELTDIGRIKNFLQDNT